MFEIGKTGAYSLSPTRVMERDERPQHLQDKPLRHVHPTTAPISYEAFIRQHKANQKLQQRQNIEQRDKRNKMIALGEQTGLARAMQFNVVALDMHDERRGRRDKITASVETLPNMNSQPVERLCVLESGVPPVLLMGTLSLKGDIFMARIPDTASENGYRKVRLKITQQPDGTTIFMHGPLGGISPEVTAFHRSIVEGNINVNAVRFVLEDGINVEARNIFDETPLYAAVSQGDKCIKITKILLEYGADPKLEGDGNNMETALRAAAKQGYKTVETAKFLAEKGAKVPNTAQVTTGSLNPRQNKPRPPRKTSTLSRLVSAMPINSVSSTIAPKWQVKSYLPSKPNDCHYLLSLVNPFQQNMLSLKDLAALGQVGFNDICFVKKSFLQDTLNRYGPDSSQWALVESAMRQFSAPSTVISHPGADRAEFSLRHNGYDYKISLNYRQNEANEIFIKKSEQLNDENDELLILPSIKKFSKQSAMVPQELDTQDIQSKFIKKWSRRLKQELANIGFSLSHSKDALQYVGSLHDGTAGKPRLRIDKAGESRTIPVTADRLNAILDAQRELQAWGEILAARGALPEWYPPFHTRFTEQQSVKHHMRPLAVLHFLRQSLPEGSFSWSDVQLLLLRYREQSASPVSFRIGNEMHIHGAQAMAEALIRDSNGHATNLYSFVHPTYTESTVAKNENLNEDRDAYLFEHTFWNSNGEMRSPLATLLRIDGKWWIYDMYHATPTLLPPGQSPALFFSKKFALGGYLNVLTLKPGKMYPPQDAMTRFLASYQTNSSTTDDSDSPYGHQALMRNWEGSAELERSAVHSDIASEYQKSQKELENLKSIPLEEHEIKTVKRPKKFGGSYSIDLTQQEINEKKSLLSVDVKTQRRHSDAAFDESIEEAQRLYRTSLNVGQTTGKNKLYLGRSDDVKEHAQKKPDIRNPRSLSSTKWKPFVNEAWIQGGFDAGSRFKIKSFIDSNHAEMMSSGISGVKFLSYVRNAKPDLLYDVNNDRPNYFSVELGMALERGYTFSQIPRAGNPEELKQQLLPSKEKSEDASDGGDTTDSKDYSDIEVRIGVPSPHKMLLVDIEDTKTFMRRHGEAFKTYIPGNPKPADFLASPAMPWASKAQRFVYRFAKTANVSLQQDFPQEGYISYEGFVKSIPYSMAVSFNSHEFPTDMLPYRHDKTIDFSMVKEKQEGNENTKIGLALKGKMPKTTNSSLKGKAIIIDPKATLAIGLLDTHANILAPDLPDVEDTKAELKKNEEFDVLNAMSGGARKKFTAEFDPLSAAPTDEYQEAMAQNVTGALVRLATVGLETGSASASGANCMIHAVLDQLAITGTENIAIAAEIRQELIKRLAQQNIKLEEDAYLDSFGPHAAHLMDIINERYPNADIAMRIYVPMPSGGLHFSNQGQEGGTAGAPRKNTVAVMWVGHHYEPIKQTIAPAWI